MTGFRNEAEPFECAGCGTRLDSVTDHSSSEELTTTGLSLCIVCGEVVIVEPGPLGKAVTREPTIEELAAANRNPLFRRTRETLLAQIQARRRNS